MCKHLTCYRTRSKRICVIVCNTCVEENFEGVPIGNFRMQGFTCEFHVLIDQVQPNKVGRCLSQAVQIANPLILSKAATFRATFFTNTSLKAATSLLPLQQRFGHGWDGQTVKMCKNTYETVHFIGYPQIWMILLRKNNQSICGLGFEFWPASNNLMFSLKLSFFWAKIPQMLPVEQEWLPKKKSQKKWWCHVMFHHVHSFFSFTPFKNMAFKAWHLPHRLWWEHLFHRS